MPIKNVTNKGLSFPEIGRIKKGETVEIGQGKSKPVDLDYFKVEFNPGFEQLENKFFAVYDREPKAIQIVLPFNEIDRMWDAYLEAYTASRMIARSDGKPEDGGIILYKCDPKTGEALILNGRDVATGAVVPHPEDNIAGYDYKNNPIYFNPRGRLKVLIPVLEEAAYMTMKTGSWWDIQNISDQLAGLKELNNGIIKGVPLTLMRGDHEIMAPIDGKKVRVTKSLVSIKADSDWVAARIQADRLAAFPEHIVNTMLEPGTNDFVAEPAQLPSGAKTPPAGEIVEEQVVDAPEDENPAEAPQDGQAAQKEQDGKPTRPYDAETLKARLHAMISAYDSYLERDPSRYEVNLETDKQVVAAVVGKKFDDTARYAIFRYLFGEGKASTKTWTAYEMGAVKNLWLSIVNFDDELADIPLQEMVNVWNAAQSAEGQLQAF